MESLDWCEVASPRQIHDFIRRHRLAGKGVGWVDAALLAAPSRAVRDELRPGRLCERVEDKPLPWIPVRRNEWMTATGTTES